MSSKWERKKLSDICLLITKGSTPTTYGFEFIDHRHDATMFIGAYNCSIDGTAKTDTKKWICPNANKLLKRSILNEGDSVFCIVGNTIGSSFSVNKDILPANINQNVALIRPDRTALTPQYLHYLLRSSHIQTQVIKEASTQAQPSLSLKQIGEFEVSLPPLPEQTKIAKILSTWDKAIATTERMLANSQQQKLALMQQLLTGQKRFTEFNGEWKSVTLINLGDTFTGLKGKTKDDFGIGHPYIPYINIFKNSAIDTNAFDYVKIESSENQSEVQFGDIFFTTSSETPEEVGMSSVLLEQVSHVYLNSFCFGFRLFDFKNLIPEYARYLLRSEFMRKSISELAQGATRYNLSKKQLMQLELLLPPIPEQQKIAQVLATADAETANLQAQLAKLRLEKKALMQQLLTGQRRVGLDDEAAAPIRRVG